MTTTTIWPSEPSAETLARQAARRELVVILIGRSVHSRGYPPTLVELSREMGVTVRTVTRDLDTLRELGRVEWTPGLARTLRVIDPGRSAFVPRDRFPAPRDRFGSPSATEPPNASQGPIPGQEAMPW